MQGWLFMTRFAYFEGLSFSRFFSDLCAARFSGDLYYAFRRQLIFHAFAAADTLMLSDGILLMIERAFSISSLDFAAAMARLIFAHGYAMMADD